jgi:uncharacterized OB-fold protein
MEEDLPFSIGIVQLDKVGLRILSRIETPFKKLVLDMPMELTVVRMPGDRVLYRFKGRR